MKTELSDNDRQRIEQEAAKLFNRWDGGLVNVQTMLLSIAEYATLFERQQQSELLQENERQSEQIKKLEGENKELRESMISMIKEVVNYTETEFPGYRSEKLDYIKAALNL